MIPKLMGVPIILDLHDLMPEFYAGRYGNSKSLTARLIRLQERLACRFADHVITVSEHWRQALIRRGVPEKKCSVVMNVADESHIPSIGTDLDNYTHVKDSFRLIYHGTLVERYGLDLAIKAVDRVRFDIPGIHLTLVGFGDYLPHLKEMVEDLRLNEYVTFVKLQLAEKLPDLIRSCHLGIVPYRNDIFTDGLLPTKLMEYAALGMPAIAARTSAIHAYFKDTMTEFFEPDNLDDLVRCILALYNNPERLSELACGCQKFNQQYNWAKVSSEYAALVDDLSRGYQPASQIAKSLPKI